MSALYCNLNSDGAMYATLSMVVNSTPPFFSNTENATSSLEKLNIDFPSGL